MLAAEKNYVIQVNDQLNLDVLSNNGERLIDPNSALVAPPASGAQQVTTDPSYLVAVDGSIKFPLIGNVPLAGMTIREAEAMLEKEFGKFYKECYVMLSFVNKRVIVLGATTGQVIPLTNENVSLIEVLAMATGTGASGKAHNIRVIRGKEVYIVDLSTIEGAVKNNMMIHAGDIVYVEPVQRPFAEGLRDYAPFMNIIIGIATLIVVFTASNSSN